MASRGINKVILIGNLGKDPEVRYTASGGAVANIRIATSESWRDKQSGELQERTEWHSVVMFGKLGEIAGEYLRKGSKVFIEGRLQTRKWQDQSGQDRYTTEVVASDMQMLDSRSGGSTSMDSQDAPPPRSSSSGSSARPPAANRSSGDFGGGSEPSSSPSGDAQNPGGFDNDFDDDIPF